MRLIDVDKLLDWYKGSKTKYPVTKDHSAYQTMMMYEIFDEIEDAETVEAIPIEWIEQQISELEDSAEYERIELNEFGVCCQKQSAYRNLIEKWRTECQEIE